jgi:ATP:corrinoid adenosyltransferase
MEQASDECYKAKAAIRHAVTEMRLIKHPYKAGLKAQRGVEF